MRKKFGNDESLWNFTIALYIDDGDKLLTGTSYMETEARISPKKMRPGGRTR